MRNDLALSLVRVSTHPWICQKRIALALAKLLGNILAHSRCRDTQTKRAPGHSEKEGGSLGVSRSIVQRDEHDAAHEDAGLEHDGGHADDEGLALEQWLAEPQVEQLRNAQQQQQNDLRDAVVGLDCIAQQRCDGDLEYVHQPRVRL